MDFDFSALNWLAVLVSVIAGQVISTLWFVVIFAAPWAEEYGAADAKQHTAEIPPYTYGLRVLSTATLTLSIALLQGALGTSGAMEGIMLGLVVAVGFCCATMLPGQAFLKRLRVFAIAAGSQTVMILAISTILAVWK